MAVEIKELAVRVRMATKEIAEIVKTVRRNSSEAVDTIRQGQHEVKNGVVVAEKAGEALQKFGEVPKIQQQWLQKLTSSWENRPRFTLELLIHLPRYL